MNAFGLSMSLLLSLLESVGLHYSPFTMEHLLGREYTEIPAGVCNGTAEILLGEASGYEYSSLICTQQPQSYMVLQRLVGYTTDRKAILKAVTIQTLPVMQAGEVSINRGCQAQDEASTPIIAVVRDQGTPTYQTIRAWKADLTHERFQELNPQSVTCQRLRISGTSPSPGS